VDVKTQRRQDIAVGDDGTVHVVFGVQLDPMHDPVSTGVLYYARKSSDRWDIELALEPLTAPHETGWAPSLCLDRSGRPVVASTYIARVRSRSISYAHLQYSIRKDEGRWETTIVAGRDDGYYSTDGRRYTGGLPHLFIDRNNTPHIVFSDIASFHDPKNLITIGQIRYAVWNGSEWDITTLYRQPSPQSFFVAREMGGACLAMSDDGNSIQVVGQELTSRRKGDYEYKLVHIQIK
jgi:hypothetical protein